MRTSSCGQSGFFVEMPRIRTRSFLSPPFQRITDFVIGKVRKEPVNICTEQRAKPCPSCNFAAAVCSCPRYSSQMNAASFGRIDTVLLRYVRMEIVNHSRILLIFFRVCKGLHWPPSVVLLRLLILRKIKAPMMKTTTEPIATIVFTSIIQRPRFF